MELRADEGALARRLRKKWRQYVNKARNAGIIVVDGGEAAFPTSTGSTRETADRAGFLIRTEAAYRHLDAYAPAVAPASCSPQTPDGQALATLFLVRSGPRWFEPYGGMTAAGGRLPCQLPAHSWEAIRSSREAGATSYDLWGLATGGIAQFKTGSGRRCATSGPGTSFWIRSAGEPTIWRSAVGLVDPATARDRRSRRGRGLRAGRLSIRDARPDELADGTSGRGRPQAGTSINRAPWAEHRRASGWTPRFLVTTDGGRVLALPGPGRPLGGGALPAARPGALRGWGGPGCHRRAPVAVAEVLGREGIASLRQIPRSRPRRAPTGRKILASGFHRSRRSSRRGIGSPCLSATGRTSSLSSRGDSPGSTRQRVRGAERDGVGRGSCMTPGWAAARLWKGSRPRPEPVAPALDRFFDLLLETGARRHFSFGPRAGFVCGLVACRLRRGHLAYLEARAADRGTIHAAAGEPIAGLLL